MSGNIALFGLAASFEIAGCFAFWMWARRGGGLFVVLLGIASLIAFAFVLTRVDSAFAGRAYAAYGGIYIAASSLLWFMGCRRATTHTRTDLIGTALAVGRANEHARQSRRSRAHLMPDGGSPM